MADEGERKAGEYHPTTSQLTRPADLNASTNGHWNHPEHENNQNNSQEDPTPLKRHHAPDAKHMPPPSPVPAGHVHHSKPLTKVIEQTLSSGSDSEDPTGSPIEGGHSNNKPNNSEDHTSKVNDEENPSRKDKENDEDKNASGDDDENASRDDNTKASRDDTLHTSRDDTLHTSRDDTLHTSWNEDRRASGDNNQNTSGNDNKNKHENTSGDDTQHSSQIEHENASGDDTQQTSRIDDERTSLAALPKTTLISISLFART